MPENNKQLTYIDLFAGCGGLAIGLQAAGWHPMFAIEKNAQAFETYKDNLIDKEEYDWPSWLEKTNHDINEILKKYPDKLEALQGKVDLVAGGPPCQGFSLAGERNQDDLRNKLVKAYVKFIRLVMPRFIIFENVRGFTVRFTETKRHGKTRKYSSYIEHALERTGYHVAHQIVDMSEYGIPEKRHRFILVASLDASIPPSNIMSLLYSNRDDFCKSKGLSTTVSVGQAISDLEKSHGTVSSPDTKGFMAGVYGEAQSNYQKLMRHGIIIKQNKAVNCHRFVNHTEKTIKLHEALLEKAPRNKRLTPSNNFVPNLNRRGVTVLDYNSPAPTLTSIPDELVHYSEPRILTVREYARIQSFPDWFEFKGPYTTGGKRRKIEVPRYTQIGNAVPPLFAEQIGVALKKASAYEQTNQT
ncbi:DNA cytosine methyltransferase [Bifidobacterium sp. ESL0728]|uniref:DNA cytosine methyltransferase n=1 Tax=Bifidobacterium sp. ESL0728 TaxID=2983220 RepID=UPI0023F80817|nr:DNA cytosine methyltransferase [Bifidobacterium sp. ESL0728]WEV59543.1 DNA cytosine methyltransferase [Bifidobacterium sp. ESL0728]